MIWGVVTPEYGTVMSVLDDGSGPMEYGCDYVEVECERRSDVLPLAVKLLRNINDGWLDDVDGCPFTGLKIVDVCQRCREQDDGLCAFCEKELGSQTHD